MANVATLTATPVATETPQTAEVKRDEVVDTAADDSSSPKREGAPLESDDNEQIINARITRDFGPRDILSHMLQTIGIIAAIIFGIWAVRSYNVSVTQLDASNAANSAANDASASSYSQMLSAARTQSMAYEQNLIANQLALVQLCAIRTGLDSVACSIAFASAPLRNIASTLYITPIRSVEPSISTGAGTATMSASPTATGSASPTATQTSSAGSKPAPSGTGKHLSLGAIIIIVTVCISSVMLGVGCYLWFSPTRRTRFRGTTRTLFRAAQV